MREDAALRVLVMSHGHPALTCGGAEISAHALFEALQMAPGCSAWFLGCHRAGAPGRPGAAITQPFGQDEFVYRPGAYDWLKFANRDPAFPEAFRALLLELQPDVVHFHHFIHFGVDAIGIVRQTLPEARIVLTLHEYLAICHHYGQMVTTGRDALCHQASLEECHRCFPGVSTADLFVRGLYIRRFLAEVDRFIAPSAFLAARYVAWGVAPERIEVIENLVATGAAPALASAALAARDAAAPLRVGFFGQISRLKGVNVLFEAAAILALADSGVRFELHGDYEGQPPEFQEDFLVRLAQAGPNLRYHGRYPPRRLDRLMQSVDVTIVPSIWWENSPVVIREAFRNGRPVICSDIGGMAEKVRPGLDGWHFPVGSALALADLLRRLSDNPAEVQAMRATIRSLADHQAILAAHRRCYATASGAGRVKAVISAPT